ncbi:zinc finger protein 311-like isoform X2 [Zerene cesonia]|uniref:zinc finger protein 311-like isoform X2 n=1 Tax=Zerene cesonia TaxID=33412 RepID=UPI0018E4E752|nr:zinc finger protein 311-like isoform X2 [Zerene cesonia]
MNIIMDNTNICEGCLSNDRMLFSHSDDIKQLFLQLLNVDDNFKNILNLCWECCAMLRKIIKFKKQIRTAQETMYNLLNQPTTLSNLISSNCLSVECNYYNDNKFVSLIKMEDEQTNDDGGRCDVKFDVFYHNDRALNRDHCDVHYEDFKPEFDDNNDVVKSSFDFNDSDDEPLTSVKKKSKNKTKRKEGKRREKESGVVQNARVLKKLQQLNVHPDHLEMVILSWDEVQLERAKALASDTFTRHSHKCYNCVIGFNHRCKLDEHMKKHQLSAGTSECDVCHIRCKDKQALSSHRRRHRVSTLGKLRNHMKKTHSEQHKCELCDKVFRDRTSLRTHLFIHRGVKEYACPKCGKQFLFKKAMEIHLVTHESSANMYCHECDMTFKNQMSFNQHMKYNLKHIDPARLKYACKLCDKKFVKATRLEEHNMAVHLKLTPITCTVPGCGFACSSRAVLRSHARAHAAVVPRRDHVCDVCGKTYTSKKSLEGHLRAHSGARPFRCALCAAAFGYQAALYNHNKLVHLKVKTNRSRQQQTNSDWVAVETPNVP